jgi:hypothetical protein
VLLSAKTFRHTPEGIPHGPVTTTLYIIFGGQGYFRRLYTGRRKLYIIFGGSVKPPKITLISAVSVAAAESSVIFGGLVSRPPKIKFLNPRARLLLCSFSLSLDPAPFVRSSAAVAAFPCCAPRRSPSPADRPRRPPPPTARARGPRSPAAAPAAPCWTRPADRPRRPPAVRPRRPPPPRLGHPQSAPPRRVVVRRHNSAARSPTTKPRRSQPRRPRLADALHASPDARIDLGSIKVFFAYFISYFRRPLI